MPALKPVDFWKWKAHVEVMKHAETKVDLAIAKAALMEKNIETDRYKAILFKQQSMAAVQEVKNSAKKEYEEILEAIEKKLGTKLAGKVINEVTLEVTDPTTGA